MENQHAIPFQKLELKWKRKLTPAKFKDFDEFNKYQKSNAKFGRCTNCSKDSKIFFNCADCCREIDSVYCIFCFLKSDHTNHRVSVFLNDNAVCDCGDPRSIKASSFCNQHKTCSIQEDFPDDKSSKRLNVVIREIFDYILLNISNEGFSESLSILLEIMSWGTTYCNLISFLLFDGSWDESYFGRIYQSKLNLGHQNIDKFSHFLFKNASSLKFKQGFAKFIYDFMKTSLVIYQDNNDFESERLDLFDVSYQCFHNADINIPLEQDHKMFTRILHLLNELHSYAPFKHLGQLIIPKSYNINFHNTISNLFVLIFANALFVKNIVSNTEFLEELATYFSINSENAIITRETGEKSPFNTIDGFHHFYNFIGIQLIIESFTKSFSYLTVDFNEDLSSDIVSKLPIKMLDQSHIEILNQLYGILIKKLDKFLDSVELRDNSFGSSSYYIQPYNDPFTIKHPLATFIIQSATCFSIYNSLDTTNIFSRIGFTKFDQFAALLISCIAAKFQFKFGMFAKNDDSYYLASQRYDISELISGIQSILSMKAAQGSAGSIVLIIAESFGLPICESMTDEYDLTNWANVITMMLWLFIIMACFDNFFYFNMDMTKMTRLVTDLVYSDQRTTRAELLKKLRYYSNNTVLSDEAIEQVVDIRADEKGSHFTLKTNEFTTIFSPYSVNEYLQLLANEIDAHKGMLFNIFPVDTTDMPAFQHLKSYLHTDEMIQVIVRVLKFVINNHSISLAHTVFSLIRLILIDSQTPEQTEEQFISNDIIRMLIIIMGKFDNGGLYLRNFANECVLKYPTIVQIINENVEIKEKKKPKIDRNEIMKQFKNALNLFEQKNKDEIDSIQNTTADESKCAFCDEPFDLKNDSYGVLVLLFHSTLLSKVEATIAGDHLQRHPRSVQIRACGHWTHRHCFAQNVFAELNENVEDIPDDIFIRCALDRSISNKFIPVIHGDDPVNSDLLIDLGNTISGMCGLSAQQCLADNLELIEILCRHNPTYIDDKRSILGLIHFLRACFYIPPYDKVSETNDPFVYFTFDFCKEGNLKNAREVFDQLLPKFWHDLLCSAKMYTDKEEQMSMIQTYVRRASLLEYIAFQYDSQSFFFPSVDEFITSHNLTPIDVELEKCTIDLDHAAFLVPCNKYSFPNLKENFIDYFLEPKIVDNCAFTNYDFCQCMMCGKLCYIQKHIFGDADKCPKMEPIIDHIFKCSGTFAPILFITGEFASSLFLFDLEFPQKHQYPSLYTDVYGDTNIGLKYDNILHLNNGRVEKLIEDLLSANFKRFMTT